MSVSLSIKSIEKYFSFLFKLDSRTKEKLIEKLKSSIKDDEKKVSSQSVSYFGSWEDDKSSDEIISHIRESRVDRSENLEFD
jgi:hypothetical protein